MVIDGQCSSSLVGLYRNHEFNHGIQHFDVFVWQNEFLAAKSRNKFRSSGAHKFRRLRRRAACFSAAAQAERTRFRLARRQNSAAQGRSEEHTSELQSR